MKFDFSGLAKHSEKTRGQVGTLGTPSNGKVSSRPQSVPERGDNWGQFAGGTHEQRNVSPVSPTCPHSGGQSKPLQTLAVPSVPNVPNRKHIAEDFREAFEERAAIREFDGGLDRVGAERAAEDDLLVTVNVRGLGRAEVRIPKTRADALAMLELIEQFTDKATLQ